MSSGQAPPSAPVQPIVRRRLTVVFDVRDESCVSQLYDAHCSGTLVCGGVPAIIASGDQVSVPQDIVDVLAGLDPEVLDRDVIAMLIEQAVRFQKTH